MQYHPRDSLRARIHSVGPLTWVETLHIGVKIAGALETAHRLGTLHRDIKPANILLTEYGEPQLADFGIARIAGGFEPRRASQRIACVHGTRGPSRPQPNSASDVYSLGATLFCALTGHAAFERRSDERIVAQFLRVAAQPTAARDLAQIPDDVSAASNTHGEQSRRSADDGGRLWQQAAALQSRHGLTVDDMTCLPCRRSRCA